MEETGNSDQGSPYTFSIWWIANLEKHAIRVSVDGRGRDSDKIYMERF
ncbi:hypothetical protein SAMN05444412_11362 [Rhodonellum ikkaensis]|nr:hypothetical protein SAMN05444412_11362 [Rhodonellum ikkaensis]